MRSSILVSSALYAVSLAAPSLPALTPTQSEVVSNFFQLVASKVQAGKGAAPPVCNLDNAVLPLGSPALPPPSNGLHLVHVAVGRGTQNYTCASSTAAPAAIGAVATLYNASCVAATSPDVLAAVPNVALQFNLTSLDQNTLTPANLVISGHHYFTGLTTPFFDLNTATQSVGTIPCSKANAVPAPAGAPAGQGNTGSGSVPWLKLVARDGATGGLQEVYRVNTAGGSPPATCAGQPSAFQVQYAAEYWFYAS